MITLSRITCAAVAAFALVGCAGGTSKSGKLTVGFVSNNAAAWWNIAKAGARKAESELSLDVQFRKPNPGNASTQKENVQNVLNTGAKAVAVSVIDPKNQTDYLDEIAEKVPLLAVDNDAPRSKRLAYIGTDNYAAGKAVGKLVKEALGEKGGTVAIFVGQLDALNARQRRQGVIDELLGREPPQDLNDFKTSPDGEAKGVWKLHAKTYTDQPEGQKRAQENAEDFLGKLPEGNVCLVGLWAYNPPACLAALEKVKDDAVRARVKIVGFDEDPATLDAIEKGIVHGTVVQDPFEFGYQSVKLMAALAKGDKNKLPKDGLVHIPYRIIQKADGDADGLKRLAVGPFRKKLEELMGKK